LKLEKMTAEKLQEVDALKSNFFANLSHEFRTPLALIKATVGKLHSAPINAFESDYQLIDRQAGQMLDMINQLLDLSKLEAGKLILNPQPVELSGFLKDLAGSFVALFESHGLTFRYTLLLQPVWVNADGANLTRILSNLLTNAAKFTPAGGQVQFLVVLENLHSDAVNLRITVEDTGIGISAQQLPNIFDRFFQADSSLTRSYQGTGIGLALVKELVELHKGVIKVESTPGTGTIFTIQLPLPVVDQPHQHTTPQKIHDVSAKGGDAVGGEYKPVTGQKAQLLIIEDNADLRNFLVDSFASEYKTLAAGNGNDGLELALAHLPDLIISDIMMPEIDGVELCRRLKTDERTSHIPVILLTAKAGTKNKLEGLETGADDYLTKPFEREELLTRVKNLLAGRKLLRERFGRQLLVQPAEVSVTSADEKFLEKVFGLLEENLSNADFDVTAFSKEIGMSQTHLHRKLTALLGQSANELIRTFRLKRAASLLSQQHGNVSEIAFMVGFTNANYFSKCFRDQFSQTPTEYARVQTVK
jgi:DNA-binding response OmpR family regulator/two-component sensor histidine kinase